MNIENHKKILVLNGPNLNLLGTREPETYGHNTIDQLEALSVEAAAKHGLTVDFRQTNSEGTLVDWIQEGRNGYAAIILNAAAYTHTSVGIGDAIKAISTPVIEVHISNTFAREAFRHQSYISKHAKGIIVGFGLQSYELAIKSFL